MILNNNTMSTVFYFLVVVLLLFLPNSKSLRVISLVYLLILFCFNTDCADRESYVMDMLNVDIYEREYLWQVVLRFWRDNHLDFQYLVAGIGVLYLPSLYYVTGKLSNKSNLVVACYMIGLFFLDVVQLRYTASLIFVLWAFYLYFSKKEHHILYFIVFICISSLIHASNIIFLSYILAEKYDKQKLRMIVLILFVVLSLGVYIAMAYLGSIFGIVDKITRLTTTEYESSKYIYRNCLCEVIVFLYVLYLNAKNKDLYLAESGWKLIYNMAYISLLFLPFLQLFPDIRRQIYVNFIILLPWICRLKQNKAITQNIYIWAVIVAIYYFLIGLYPGNMDTVFYPIFDNNLIFNSLFI